MHLNATHYCYNVSVKNRVLLGMYIHPEASQP